MITTVKQLHDHVNRYHSTGRLDGVDGRLSIYGRTGVILRNSTSIIVTHRNIDRLEIRENGPAGGYVKLAHYDEAAAATEIQRWEARHHFNMSLKIAHEATARLLEAMDALHLADAVAVRDQYGPLFDCAVPEPLDTRWPDG